MPPWTTARRPCGPRTAASASERMSQPVMRLSGAPGPPGLLPKFAGLLCHDIRRIQTVPDICS